MAKKEIISNTFIDRFNNKFVIDQHNTLLSFEGNNEEVEFPNELETIGKKVFVNKSFKNMYLNKNIKTFNRGAFINNYKIDNMYYPGSFEDFNKIYFEPGCAKRPIL